MTRALNLLRSAAVPLVVLALVVGAAITVFGGQDTKKLTALFPRTVSIYVGSDVRVLGVPVGTVDSVTPSGTDVVVTMSYRSDVKVPANAKAVIIAPSIVGDRYVQLTPVYREGDQLADGTVLGEDRTAVPLELDDIYSSLDNLTVALGPDGANAEGALTDLLETTARNFGGQGEKFNQTIKNFSQLSATLDDNKEELFGSTAALGRFVKTLADNDTTVRRFSDSLAGVSTQLSDEREELAAALRNLGVALEQVSGFVQENRAVLGRDITALNRVAKVLVKRRGELDEALKAGPLALNNLALTYNPESGTLDTNANVTQLESQAVSDPSLVLCTILGQIDQSGSLCKLAQGVLGRPGALDGSAAGARDRFDPTLGGLVEATR